LKGKEVCLRCWKLGVMSLQDAEMIKKVRLAAIVISKNSPSHQQKAISLSFAEKKRARRINHEKFSPRALIINHNKTRDKNDPLNQ